jgi:hypothetical protein
MGEKVNFNELTKIITITEAPDVNGDIFIDVKTDLYSDGKEDWVSNENLRKFQFPISAVGGNPLPGEKALGSTFFLASDWKIKPYSANHRLTINGNLYAEDGSDAFLDPDGSYTVRIMQQVSSLVDSTVQQLSEIEYASFNGMVTLDSTSSYSGTNYPVGTPQEPVNNLADALLIASDRGFTKLFILNDLALDDNYDLDGFTIEGQSSDIIVQIDSIASVNNLSVTNLSLYDSTLDGGVEVSNCIVRDITYLNGYIHNSGLAGTVTLGGNRKSVIADCYTVDMDNPVVVDMGGSGNDLAMPNYSGLVTIRNLSNASNEIGIGMDAGAVTLDSTISAGLCIVSGIGTLADNSTGTTVVNTDGIINKEQISQAVWDEPIQNHLVSGTTGLSVGIQQFNGVVTLDVVNGQSGTDFPTGTQRVPVNNIPDAVAIATTRGINSFKIIGNITASGGPFAGYHVYGENVQDTIITASDLDCQGVTFENCTITGNFINDSYITTINCTLIDVTDIELIAWDTSFGGFVKLIEGSGGKCVFYNCFDDIPGIGIPDIQVNTCLNLGIWNFNGGIRLSTMTEAATVVSLMIAQGRLWVDDTCVAGDIIVKGLADLRGTTGGTTVDYEGLITLDTISEGVWKSVGDKIFVDPSTANTGTTYPVGTAQYPVNNLTDAKTIGELQGIKVIHIHGDVTFDVDFDGWKIEAHNVDTCTANLNGRDVTNCVFNSMSVEGSYIGHANFIECNIMNGLSNVDAHFENCILAGTFVVSATGELNGDRCTSSTGCLFNLSGSASLSMANFGGVLAIANLNNVAAVIGITGQYLLTLDSSLTAGQALIAGIGIINDNSNGLSVTQRTIPDTVWDVDTSNFTTNGTVGKELVARLDRSLGLMQENFEMDNQTYQDYNGAKLLTSARIRTFSDDSLTQLLATYQVTATWSNGQCTSYQVAKI